MSKWHANASMQLSALYIEGKSRGCGKIRLIAMKFYPGEGESEEQNLLKVTNFGIQIGVQGAFM